MAFIVPRLPFPIRMRTVSVTDVSSFDAKELLGLPDRASTSFIYSSRSGGGIGLPEFRIEALLSYVLGAFKLFTSKDPVVRELGHG